MQEFSQRFKEITGSQEFAAWKDCSIFHTGMGKFQVICQPPNVTRLKQLLTQLAAVEFNGKGTEPGYEGRVVSYIHTLALKGTSGFT